MNKDLPTPRTDLLAASALKCAVGDLPFDEAFELCETLEKELVVLQDRIKCYEEKYPEGL